MSKEWTGSVRINAPVEAVYAYLADFANQPEWDTTTVRIEQVKPGDATGVGAEYRAYERLDWLSRSGDNKSEKSHQAGVSDREVRELVPNRRVAWHSHAVPRMGVTMDYAFELVADGDDTELTETVRLNSPGVMDALQKVVLPKLDDKQRALWRADLERIKHQVEKLAPVAV
jgi:uncharacterized membrane protein